MNTITDAAGRTVHEGDHVGGTVPGRHQCTITGPVVKIGRGTMQVRVTNRPLTNTQQPQNGDELWVCADRLFLVHTTAEHEFVGYRTPDGYTWTKATGTPGILYETPMVPRRYEPGRLRTMYDGALTPVWKDGPDALRRPTSAIRAQSFLEAAARITALPQDYELDPGRGEVRALLERMAADAEEPGAYPPVLPWALLLAPVDLAAFLRDLTGSMHGAAARADMTSRPQGPHVLEALERVCGTWRAIAETQHAHNTAPGPHA